MIITELITSIEQRAEKAENLDFCKGIKLIKIKENIASMLETIGTNINKINSIIKKIVLFICSPFGPICKSKYNFYWLYIFNLHYGSIFNIDSSKLLIIGIDIAIITKNMNTKWRRFND